jgi:hypothetical protein
MTEQQPFEVTTEIDAPIVTVWRALTVPAIVHEWFGYDYDGLDAEIQAIFAAGPQLTEPTKMEFDDGSSIQLAADGPRTIVRAVLPGSLTDAQWEDLYDDIAEGWRTFLEQLRFLLETRPSGQRRTLYLTGKASGAQVAGLVSGKPWYSGRRQRHCVEPQGHLLALAVDQDLAGTEIGSVNLLITTFGLEDAAFEQLRDPWVRRWTETVQSAEVQP